MAPCHGCNLRTLEVAVTIAASPSSSSNKSGSSGNQVWWAGHCWNLLEMTLQLVGMQSTWFCSEETDEI